MKRETSFSSSYSAFWKKIFDYKGTSSLREYWQPVGLHIGLCVLAVIFYVLSRNESEWFRIPFWILTVYLVISFVPFVALTVRRLRDTGMSGLWALLLLFVGAGTCVVLCLCAAGSSFLPWNNRPVNVYGPPEWFQTSAFDPANNEPIDVYGPPSFDPSETESDDFNASSSEDTEEETSTEKEFDATENIPAPVYGPPEWFGITEKAPKP